MYEEQVESFIDQTFFGRVSFVKDRNLNRGYTLSLSSLNVHHRLFQYSN